jgi:branched-chain amino acid transport system permease protein
VACGLSLIFGVSRIVNLAHGSFYMVGAYLAYYLIEYFPHGAVSFWAGILLAALFVGVIGLLVETLLLRRLYRAPELFILFATFGIVLIIQDLSRWQFGAEDLLGQQAPGLAGSVNIMGTLLPQYDLVLIIIAPLILIGLWFLLNRTRWGILVRAATEDREMSDALGVNQTWLFTSVFFLGSVLAGLGGAIQLPKGGADLLMDLNIIAAAFVVVVVGGMGSIPGAYLAAVIIGELSSFGVLVFPESTKHPGPDVFSHGCRAGDSPLWPAGQSRSAGAWGIRDGRIGFAAGIKKNKIAGAGAAAFDSSDARFCRCV